MQFLHFILLCDIEIKILLKTYNIYWINKNTYLTKIKIPIFAMVIKTIKPKKKYNFIGKYVMMHRILFC